MSILNSDIVPAASTWVFITLGIMQQTNRPLKMKNKTKNEQTNKKEMREILELLDTHLKKRICSVVEQMALDITVVCILL